MRALLCLLTLFLAVPTAQADGRLFGRRGNVNVNVFTPPTFIASGFRANLYQRPARFDVNIGVGIPFGGPTYGGGCGAFGSSYGVNTFGIGSYGFGARTFVDRFGRVVTVDSFGNVLSIR